jgi:hypothetical protein
MGEDHEVVFVVADDVASAKVAARAKWRGDTVELVLTASGGDRTALEDCN